MKLSDSQIEEVCKIIEIRQRIVGGEINLREDTESKFIVGDSVRIILNDWGEYLENPISAIVLACYRQEGSKYGDYPELYILELEGGKIEGGYHAKYLLKKDDVIL